MVLLCVSAKHEETGRFGRRLTKQLLHTRGSAYSVGHWAGKTEKWKTRSLLSCSARSRRPAHTAASTNHDQGCICIVPAPRLHGQEETVSRTADIHGYLLMLLINKCVTWIKRSRGGVFLSKLLWINVFPPNFTRNIVMLVRHGGHVTLNFWGKKMAEHFHSITFELTLKVQ